MTENSDPRFETEHLRFLTIRSEALQGRGDVTLFLPPHPQAFVILLHGVFGSHWAWAFKGGAHRTAQRLMEQRRIRPMALAMPSDGLRGDGTGYVPDEWVMRDVVRAVDLSTDRLFLCGLSMGGFAALRLGARHRVRGVSAHSSITTAADFRRFIDTTPDADDVLPCLLQNRAGLPAIRFDCGTEDPLLEANRTLHRELERRAIPHRYEEFPGGHSWAYWSAHLEDSLLFFEELC
jgi:pimeloyl-ACP methyl ester carboxylesterase